MIVGAGNASIVECRVLRNDFNILIQPAESVTVIAGDGPSGSFAGWISGNRSSVNMAGNYVTGITLSGNFVVDGNRVTGCGRYGIYSEGVVDGMQITNYSLRNEYRLPDYFRVDISMNFEGNLKRKKLFHGSWSASVYNLTGRRNAYSVYFKSESGKIKGYRLSIFGVPIFSISYNFKLGNYDN